MTKNANRIVSSILILANFYFVPLSIRIMKNGGGPMGYGLLLLPILFTINFLIISACRAYYPKYQTSIELLVFNSIGLIWTLFWFFFFATA